MFTGLVETLGTVREAAPDGAGTLLRIEEPTVALDLPLGASVAVNGVCLTVVAADGSTFAFQAGPETLRLTNLGELRPGTKVNLERALRVGDRLGGHIVQGHVDGVGTIDGRERQADWETVWFACPQDLTRQMIRKGSITVDGVSLTLVDVEPGRFSVALIPHTMSMTTLGFKQPGEMVNLEIDLFAKYVFKCLEQMNLPAIR
ncbi:MAG: riboflavin synthase [Planctomycetes bacterium]|nr:riboflavin synthase [Planctomycetota bacterium]